MTTRPCPAVSGFRTVFYRIALVLLLLLPSCQKKKEPPPPPPPEVTVANPVRRTVTDYLEFTGNSQAVNTIQLVARVPGFLDQVFFHDGQFVKQGQLLFLIQQNTYQENLRQAESAIAQLRAQLEFSQNQLKRYSDLVQKEAVSQSEAENWQYQRDSALANLKSAEAQRNLASLNLAYTEVRAPFDGRIDRRLVDPGNLVGSGSNTVLAEISQIDPIYVYFNISDSDLARLTRRAGWRPGNADTAKWPVSAAFLEEGGFPHHGHLDFAAISLTNTSGTLLLRGVFANPSGKILPGLYSRLRVLLGERSALLVPEEAVSYDLQGAHVLVVKETKVERRGITTGTLVEGMRVVETGLDGSESVIIKGLLRSIPGQQVTPIRAGSQTPPWKPGGHTK